MAPEVAIRPLLTAAEARMRAIRTEIGHRTAEYRSRPAERTGPVPVEVVTGRLAIQQRVAQVQRSARHELRCFDKPPYIDQQGTAAIDLELLRGGITGRTIYERDSMGQPGALPGIEALVLAGLRARTAPSLPMKLYLADSKLAIVRIERSADDGEYAMIVGASKLLDAIGRLFDVLWERALPLRPELSRAGHPEHDGRQLLGLLLAGLTDEAIARQLGVSHRTVERRIAALFASLGARTRFQAGVQAALRATPEP